MVELNELLDELQVVEARDAPTIGQVERWDGRVGAITLMGEVRPDTLIDRVE